MSGGCSPLASRRRAVPSPFYSVGETGDKYRHVGQVGTIATTRSIRIVWTAEIISCICVLKGGDKRGVYFGGTLLNLQGIDIFFGVNVRGDYV